MAEFFEVPIVREDGSSGLQYINLESIAYVELDVDPADGMAADIRVYLNNGYWFTAAGSKAEEVLSYIKGRPVKESRAGGRGA